MVVKVPTKIVVTLATKVNVVTGGKASKLDNHNNEDSNRKHKKFR
jgi:hypothetical protein